MNKLWIIPIATFLILSLGLIGGLGNSMGVGFQNQDPAMTINNISLETTVTPGPGIRYGQLTITADAIFHEDLRTISMNGTLHRVDGTYAKVDLRGKPNNGVKGQQYKLEYSSDIVSSPDFYENIEYFELTIRTVSEDGVSREITLNVSSNGQIDTNSSDVVGNISEIGEICLICGKYLKAGSDTIHMDGSRHSQAEIDKWNKGMEGDNSKSSNNNKNSGSSSNNNNERPPTEEPKPPSADYSMGLVLVVVSNNPLSFKIK